MGELYEVYKNFGNKKVEQFRKDAYHLYHGEMFRIGDCNPSGLILKKFADHFNLDTEQRIWMALLYSTCYCVPTTFVIFYHFPSYPLVIKQDRDDFLRHVQEWWNLKKPDLMFQSDRRYVKNMNWFVPILKSYMENMGENQYETLSKLKSKKADETFNNVYNFIVKNWKYYGRFSAFLFTETLSALIDNFDMNPTWIDWKQGSTATEGLCHYLNRDDLVEKYKYKGLSTSDYKYLDKEFEKLLQRFHQIFGEKPQVWDVETSLCGYRKLFKGTRYLGYYIDRQLEELYKVLNTNPDLNDVWDLVFKWREECFDSDYLGEIHGWKSIRKQFCKQFLEKGVIFIKNG